jgi:hypothetical protein
MAHAPDHSPSSHSAGAPSDHGPELSATDARAGARKGLYRVLTISTLLALVVIGLAWLAMGGLSPHSASSQRTDPNGQPVSRASQQS